MTVSCLATEPESLVERQGFDIARTYLDVYDCDAKLAARTADEDHVRVLSSLPAATRALNLTWAVESEVINGGFIRYYRSCMGQFADDTVAGILAMTGGSGCNRIVDKLDYGLIRRAPKFFGGFSDLTCLVNALHRQTGLVAFHSPVAVSEWNDYSVQSFKSIAMNAEAAVLRNPVVKPVDDLVAREERITTLRAGKAQGRLVGGNLTVLASLAGTPYFPDCRGALLFLEDINEYIYRIDRCLSTLRLCGALGQLAGVVLGRFTKCEPGDGFGSLTLDEVFDDYFLPLNVPVFRGAAIGHIRRKLTVPVGAAAEMDAEAGTIRLLAPAVA